MGGTDPNQNSAPSAPPTDATIELEAQAPPPQISNLPDSYYNSVDPPPKPEPVPEPEPKTTLKDDVKEAAVTVKEAAADAAVKVKETAQEAVIVVREAFDSEAAEKVVTGTRLFCGVCEISCHWWCLFVLFPLYISLASFGLIGFFHNMSVTWIQRQETCIGSLPQVLEQCILDAKYEVPNSVKGYPPVYLGWTAHPNTTSTRSVVLYPDCRFIIKDDYVGTDSQKYGKDLGVNATVECWLPADWRTINTSVAISGQRKNVTGILTQTTWSSNTAKTGLGASIGVAIGVLVCFIVCAGVSWAVSGDVRENCVLDLHEAGEVESSCTKLWCYPNTFYWTFNPYYCLKFAVPITATIKWICNVCIVVIVVTIIIIYAIGSSATSCRYNCY
eukprot:TRINITY_DN12829_c0_g1_i1.p1 TRINITY_DN12829_c0_g1~~TRINITY_DN12829_c0_g1_i1.p1  ORF type:complete len:388 (+),score=71.40 TRINITY_DN12829_c0_g1_i1:71-1234(+)